MSEFYTALDALPDEISGCNIIGIYNEWNHVKCTKLFLESNRRFFIHSSPTEIYEIPDDPRVYTRPYEDYEGHVFLSKPIPVKKQTHIGCILSCDGFEKTLIDLKAPGLESMILKAHDGSVTFKISKHDEIVKKLLDYARLFICEAERRLRNRISLDVNNDSCKNWSFPCNILTYVVLCQIQLNNIDRDNSDLGKKLQKQERILHGVDDIVSGRGLARKRGMFRFNKDTDCVNPCDFYPFVNTFEEYEELVQEKLNALGIDKKVW